MNTEVMEALNAIYKLDSDVLKKVIYCNENLDDERPSNLYIRLGENEHESYKQLAYRLDTTMSELFREQLKIIFDKKDIPENILKIKINKIPAKKSQTFNCIVTIRDLTKFKNICMSCDEKPYKIGRKIVINILRRHSG